MVWLGEVLSPPPADAKPYHPHLFPRLIVSVLLCGILFSAACAHRPAEIVHLSATNGVITGFEPPEYPGHVLIPKGMWVQIQKKAQEELNK